MAGRIKITVNNGTQTEDRSMREGETVGDLREAFDNGVSYVYVVNGVAKDDEYELRNGDRVELVTDAPKAG